MSPLIFPEHIKVIRITTRINCRFILKLLIKVKISQMHETKRLHYGCNNLRRRFGIRTGPPVAYMIISTKRP